MDNTILVVCSQKPETYLWVDLLKERGYKVVCCSFGCWRDSQDTHSPAIILVDFHLRENEVMIIHDANDSSIFLGAILPSEVTEDWQNRTTMLFDFSWNHLRDYAELFAKIDRALLVRRDLRIAG